MVTNDSHISSANANRASAPSPMRPKEIDGLLVPPGKAYMLLAGHLITYCSGLSACPGKVVSSQNIHTYKPFFWLSWMVIF